MQEINFSKETVSEEIKMYEELIEQWKQELTEVQEDLQTNRERISLLNELKQRVTPGSRKDITKANVNSIKVEVAELIKKEVHLSGNIQAYQEFVDELNKML